MDGKQLLASHLHLHTKFLGHLALGGVGVCLVSLALSARELPKTAVPLVRRTLTNEVTSAARDHCGQDTNERSRFR